MTYEQIDDWKMEEGKSVFLLGFTSASESIEVAISNIQKFKLFNSDNDSLKSKKEVLFVIRIWNVTSYPGFKLNQPFYSPYFEEREHVLS